MIGNGNSAGGQTPALSNVLITAAGRRVSLVRAFAEAAHERGGLVVAGDVDALAPALYMADEAVQIPPAGDPRYVARLLELVDRLRISLVVPTIDTDLHVLAAADRAFLAHGCRVAVSEVPFVDIAADKYDTGRAFEAKGIATPRSWLPPIDVDALPPVVFVKPRQGSASKDVHRVGLDDLPTLLARVPDPMIQEAIDGPEITIDALLDLDGRSIHYVPRLRIRTLGGESIQGRTLEHDASLETWIEAVLRHSAALGGRGPLTLQGFLTPAGPVLSEINPRFGGGFPLALAAGGSYPAWLLDMVAGRPVEARLRAYEPGVFMTRYHVEYFTRTLKW